MADLRNFEKLIEILRSRAAKAQKDSNASVIVGYTAAYAIFVHENLQAHHPVGRAKFLEEPARALGGVLKEMIKKSLMAGQTMSQALLQAGLRLQRDSQKLCPVDTGNLKNSAFTRLEKGS